MYNDKTMTAHDALELNEVLGGSMACMKMMAMHMNMVQDQDLKALMQRMMQTKQARMQEMQQFITNTSVNTQMH